MRGLFALCIAVLSSAAVADSQFPAVSPDGSRIAFVSNRDIYVISVDGSHLLRLTNTWSSDGRKVLFAIASSDSSTIDSVDLDGVVTEIGKVPGRAVRISPDGKRILYALGTWTAVRLMESNVDGSKARQLTDGSSVVWGPRWSPDRKTIAFTGSDADKTLHISIMNADGSNVHELAHADHAEGNMQMPAWSPDGGHIAVQVSTKERSHIWIVDAKSGSARKLAPHSEAWRDEVPSWFPDGKRLAFQSDRSGRMEIGTMSAEGSDLRQVTGTNPR